MFDIDSRYPNYQKCNSCKNDAIAAPFTPKFIEKINIGSRAR